MITIIGAGLAGLCAAHAWRKATLFDAAPMPAQMHRAVLRFRTEDVSRLTGIEFRRVRVHKGIWTAGRFHSTTTISMANRYAQKVVGRLAGERSIWNLEPTDRFVAPENFYERLLESVGDRINWATPVDFSTPIRAISTAPLPQTLGQLKIPHHCAFSRAPISIVRMRVLGADVFQTVYFPDDDCPMYRASVTGSLLTLEAVAGVEVKHWLPRATVLVERAFGISDPQFLDAGDQKFGKIVPIPDIDRKALLFELTHKHNIFSLGRFATWRNVLLDDIATDIPVIQRLLSASAYELQRTR